MASGFLPSQLFRIFIVLFRCSLSVSRGDEGILELCTGSRLCELYCCIRSHCLSRPTQMWRKISSTFVIDQDKLMGEQLLCIADLVARSSCELTNTTCICTNQQLVDAIGLCVNTNCTIRESLSRFDASSCAGHS